MLGGRHLEGKRDSVKRDYENGVSCMSKKTGMLPDRSEYLRAIIQTCLEIGRRVEEIDSKLFLRSKEERAEMEKIAKSAINNPRLFDRWVTRKVEKYAQEIMTVSIEYQNISRQVKELGLKLPPLPSPKYVGNRGYILRIRIGCMQAAAFLSDLIGGEGPKAKMI